ncbi:hypothetical protein F4810DRAFT_724475 [Camillea tinctor]|nr:hypothetical protein F4810DRAFT_724475 [Camillea tinctor]
MSLLGEQLRPALGQVADLGTLYDSTIHSFLPANLGKDISQAISSTATSNRHINLVATDTLPAKFLGLRVDNELAASFLAGTVPVSGPGSYLKVPRPSKSFVEGAIILELEMNQATLRLDKVQGLSNLSKDAVQIRKATHIVTGIRLGTIIVLAARLAVQPRTSNPQDELVRELKQLKTYIKQATYLSVNSQWGAYNRHDSHVQTFLGAKKNNKYAVFSDLQDWQDIRNITAEDVTRFMNQVPELISRQSIVPIGYTLHQSTMQFIHLFEEWRTCQREIQNYLDATKSSGHCYSCACDMNDDEKNNIHDRLNKFIEKVQIMKINYARALKNVRRSTSSPQDLAKLLRECYSTETSPREISALLEKAWLDLEFRSKITSSGGQVLNYATSRKLISTHSNLYILYFTEEMKRADKTLWETNYKILKTLLERNPGDYIVAAARCQAHELNFTSPRVTFYRHGRISTADMFAKMDLADQNYAHCNLDKIDTTRQVHPKDRRLVRIPCPGISCDNEALCDWICYVCRGPLEYFDQFFYCECGRALAREYRWQCCHKDHGREFAEYDRSKLDEYVNSLHSYQELNILLLGKTGVGKSTFINAFYNYMLHDTLDEAMARDKLDYIVPSSFSTQFIDESTPQGSFVQLDVKFGESDSERDGTTGDSATQKSTVYRIRIGNQLVRLIDTPGVGDVRGIDADAQNLSNILRTLNRLPKLDGIIILLKPNAARLTLMFRFCVKELLSSLHRNAAQNIVWGFTNTRQSNYMPGDAYRPLQRLLEKHKSLGLELTPKTVFCFDSESFRCLAVKQQLGKEMPHMEDFHRSWERSVTETRRLLQHFANIEPHDVKSTISMNRAREIIAQLTKPMAMLTDTIQRTIVLNQDKIQELESAKCKGEDLKKTLHFERIDIELLQLNDPQTVCAHPKCVELKNVAGVMRPLYTSICHQKCHVKHVTDDTVGHHNISLCSAFARSGNTNPVDHCRSCDHHWQQHLHIRYSQIEKVVQDIDPEVKKKIETNASEIQLKATSLKSLKKQIKNAEKELEVIRDASIRFGLFLKKNSITPYNDAMIAYIDEMIKEETQLVQEASASGTLAEKNVERLDMLKKSRRFYLERINILEVSMSQDDDDGQILDEQGVEDLVNKLYTLKNWGKQLEGMRAMLDWSQSNDFREQEYRPTVSKKWQVLNFMSPAIGAASTPKNGALRRTEKRPAPQPSDITQYEGPITREKRRRLDFIKLPFMS